MGTIMSHFNGVFGPSGRNVQEASHYRSRRHESTETALMAAARRARSPDGSSDIPVEMTRRGLRNRESG
jgi:hypothetical protein